MAMIWAVVTKDEMANYRIPPIFQYYREVIGKENISLAVINEDDDLSFVKDNDIVLLRSANNAVISSIRNRNIITTAEDYSVYEAANDKASLSIFLLQNGILAPRQFHLSKIDSGITYFVKPRYGGESFGITKDSICHTPREVYQQVRLLEQEYDKEVVIEEFIDGVDCTVACYYDPETESVKTYAIQVECDEVGGIQTHKGKFEYNEYCSALDDETNERVCEISKDVFHLLNIKHHARIDFRKADDGKLYLIDVNLLPGLGPSAHFAKCMLLTENKSYADAIWAIIDSATE